MMPQREKPPGEADGHSDLIIFDAGHINSDIVGTSISGVPA